MDVCKDESRRVLVSSERNKNNVVPSNGKPRQKEITSRYKSGITSAARSQSPIASKISTPSRTSTPKRAQSTERRRPSTPSSPPAPRPSPSSTPLLKPSPSSRPSTPSSSSRSSTPVRDSMVERLSSSRRSLVSRAPDGLWPSMRSLSSSFQSESSSVLASKSDRQVRNPSADCALKSSANVISERKKTPLRGRNASDQLENSKPVENSHARAVDQIRWPGMMGGKMSSNISLTKSMDLTDKITRSASLSTSARGLSPSRKKFSTDILSKSLQTSTNDAARPVSSSGREKVVPVKSLARNISPRTVERAPSITKQNSHPSPLLSLIRPASPSLIRPPSPMRTSQTSSSSRRMLSPSRSRPSTPFSSSSSTSSSVHNYIADVRKGKRSPNHLEDAHQLRLLYNRDLQWRFVNARADAAFSTQKLVAEDMLFNVWKITSELRDSVTSKRIDVQNMEQAMKLKLRVKEQIPYLEDWSALEAEYSSSLSGTIEALKASTLRLPVTGGARADLRAVKNAISSAVDVMQAMGSSICYLMSRVQATNSLISELSEVAASASIMLDECRELLASTAAMKVQECSLRTHLIQQRQDVQVE